MDYHLFSATLTQPRNERDLYPDVASGRYTGSVVRSLKERGQSPQSLPLLFAVSPMLMLVDGFDLPHDRDRLQLKISIGIDRQASVTRLTSALPSQSTVDRLKRLSTDVLPHKISAQIVKRSD